MCDEILMHEMKMARDDRIFKEKLNNSLKKIMRGSKKQITIQRYEDGELLYNIHIEYGYTYNKISVNIGCIQRSGVYTHKEWQHVNNYLYDIYRRLNNIEPKLQVKNGFECF